MANELNPNEIIDITRPSRKLRRQFSGAVCAFCPNRVHFSDAVALVMPFDKARAAHAECIALMADRSQAERLAAGASGAEEEDAPEATTADIQSTTEEAE